MRLDGRLPYRTAHSRGRPNQRLGKQSPHARVRFLKSRLPAFIFGSSGKEVPGGRAPTSSGHAGSVRSSTLLHFRLR